MQVTAIVRGESPAMPFTWTPASSKLEEATGNTQPVDKLTQHEGHGGVLHGAYP